MISLVGGALASFLLYAAIFVPLERLHAMHRQRILRPALATDLLFLFGNVLLWTPLVVALLMAMARLLDALPLGALQARFRALPFALQCVAGILLSDLAIYAFHRACHRVGWLWRIHRTHHTAETIDWIAAYREHPLDNLMTRAVENLPLLLLGFPMGAIAGFAVFRGLWALFIHANVRLSPGPLRFVLGSPRLHHWQHEAGRGGACNFGNLDPLMDLLFGTFSDPGSHPARYGIVGEPARGYAALLARPFIPEQRIGTATVDAPAAAPAASPYRLPDHAFGSSHEPRATLTAERRPPSVPPSGDGDPRSFAHATAGCSSMPAMSATESTTRSGL